MPILLYRPMIDYELIRTKRKTIVIQITKEAKVKVRAPLKTPVEKIDGFVKAKAQWIEKHLAQIGSSMGIKEQFDLIFGVELYLWGRSYPLRGNDCKQIAFRGDCFSLPLEMPLQARKAAMIGLYKQLAQAGIEEEIALFAPRMGVKPAGVRIGSAKSQWGSCSGKNRLNFSWRLALAAPSSLTYVVVHELAHMKEHNHSPQFWQVVADALPDYKEGQKGLKAAWLCLAQQDWD